MPDNVVEKQNLLVHWLTLLAGSLYGLTFNQWISLGFLVTGLFTLAVNWYYKQKHLELARSEFQPTLSGVSKDEQ